MSIRINIEYFNKKLEGTSCQLIAVTKTHPAALIMEAYSTGFKTFGENKVQEMVAKHEALPKDIKWHMLGHLQKNKVRQIASFIHLIHSVDSIDLLKEINKEGRKNNRVINCLLQMHIAMEETKFGLSFEETKDILESKEVHDLQNIKITGFMGMATNTEDKDQVRKEFKGLRTFFDEVRNKYQKTNIELHELSMGMSSDYDIAIQEGSTMIRVGSAIFGNRTYA
jgi:pyridoxal phosphate enzyme (YggS family)